ncbi:MAG: SH3 domain-containing protein [Nitrincola lacisaponensis]|uniref:SH3 domain-containing protein n=1 Tax=Nitrincola lacisaponensis TaxID=267850 RepID=UPI003919EF2F
MSHKKYVVIIPHESEFPEPITFKKGDPLLVGEEYKGSEGWDNWILCTTPGQKPGWVPGQIIERFGNLHGKALDDYTAKELNVLEGDLLLCSKSLNGWLWCEKLTSAESGWVPLGNLKEVTE